MGSSTTRLRLCRFLDMVGYYRCFCRKPLCSPNRPYIWTIDCRSAFDCAKSLLCSALVLAAPDCSQAFKINVDASASRAGAVLLQNDADDLSHPVSTKFKQHQLGYSTIEKETLAMLLAIQLFEVYVGSSRGVHRPQPMGVPQLNV